MFTCGVSRVSGLSQVKGDGLVSWWSQFFLFKHREVKTKPANRASGECSHTDFIGRTKRSFLKTKLCFWFARSNKAVTFKCMKTAHFCTSSTKTWRLWAEVHMQKWSVFIEPQRPLRLKTNTLTYYHRDQEGIQGERAVNDELSLTYSADLLLFVGWWRDTWNKKSDNMNKETEESCCVLVMERQSQWDLLKTAKMCFLE